MYKLFIEDNVKDFNNIESCFDYIGTTLHNTNSIKLELYATPLYHNYIVLNGISIPYCIVFIKGDTGKIIKSIKKYYNRMYYHTNNTTKIRAMFIKVIRVLTAEVILT